MAKLKGKNCILKLRNFLLLVIFWAVGLFVFPSFASAQTNFSYPIPELGYCRDAKECYLYCQIPENKAACWSYGRYVLGERVLGEQETADASTNEKAKALGITFPIAELGNCASVSECRVFCADPANHGVCTSFARKHGLHKRIEKRKEELMKAASEELGCTSKDSCRAFCDRPENKDRCREFATRHGLHRAAGKGIDKKELLRKAHEELGCDSMESCRQRCHEHPDKCREFVKKHGFYRPVRAIRRIKAIPGKCSTADECIRYCRQHPEECRSYLKKLKFPGPGGCDSEEACRAYCEKHPQECRGFKEKIEAHDNDSSYLGPSGCRTAAECKAFCLKHPDECPGFKKSADYQKFLEGKYSLPDQEEDMGAAGVIDEEEGLTKEEDRLEKIEPTEEVKTLLETIEQKKEEDKSDSVEMLKKICQQNNCIWEGDVCRCK